MNGWKDDAILESDSDVSNGMDDETSDIYDDSMPPMSDNDFHKLFDNSDSESEFEY